MNRVLTTRVSKEDRLMKSLIGSGVSVAKSKIGVMSI